MNIEEMERTCTGYRCRGCGITVFGWKNNLRCSQCNALSEGRWKVTDADKTSDEREIGK